MEPIPDAPPIANASEVALLRRVLLKRPQDAFVDARRIEEQWRDLGYTGRPDLRRAVTEHARFAAMLEETGAGIVYLPRDDDAGLDSIYVRDAIVVTPKGLVLCNMGKAARRGEPEAASRFFAASGLPVLGRISGDGRLEGGDVIVLDGKTIAVGQGYRTNAEGIRQLRAIVGAGIEVVAVPLPHWNGPGDVLHLMSLISPIDVDLVLAHSRLLPVPFRMWLLDRAIEIVEVPVEEFPTMGCNVLATAPARCVALSGNPLTRRAMENAGCEVRVYDGREISFKGSGGPTCLTRPLLRA